MQETKAMRVRRDGGALLDRLFDTPDIAAVVPRLPPDALHRVVDRCGLEACGALLALATPVQVAHVLDLDLWRRPDAHLDEQFDAERFGVWLEVLAGQGVDVAARTLAALDVDLVAAGLAQHVRVFHIATLEAYETTDGTEIPAVIEPDGGLACDIAGRRFIARRPDAWDAIVDVLVELDAAHPAAFARLMRACSSLSNARSEADGLDALLTRSGQAMFDLADERQQRLEARGFASPDQARAFLESARRLRLDAALPPAPAAPAAAKHEPPPRNPRDPRPPVERAGPDERAPDPPAPGQSTAAVLELLREQGVLAPPSRALLAAPAARVPGLEHLQAAMQAVSVRDPSAHATRQEELVWLANTLIAGCVVDGRTLTAQEASDAVLATCNLGLECWPQLIDGAGADDVLARHSLVTAFQVGWTVLHDEVCAAAASALMAALDTLPPQDIETQKALRQLRAVLLKAWRAGTPWHARDALDAIAGLDQLAWITLLGLIAECPVLPATLAAAPGLRRIDASAFAFIAHRSQIATIQAFLHTLPDVLRA